MTSEQEPRSFFTLDPFGVNAVLNWGNESFTVYAQAYYEAAQTLLDDTLSRRGLPDTDIYPIVFLFRHFLELTLK